MRALALLVLAVCVAGPGPADAQALGELYRRVSPSVVVIRAKGRQLSAGALTRSSEIGSGVLISTDGRVVTSAHVVHGMEEITVEFLGEDPVAARVVGFQPAADLALLQLEVVPRDALVGVMGDSSKVAVGDRVFVIGAPYGLTHSLSPGIISARWEPNTINRDFPQAEFFQTDAAINTGNSGGPMFSMAGEVIGIVSHAMSKSGGSEGLGFAITASTVQRLLIERRLFYFGFDGQIVSGPLAETLNVPQPAAYLVKTVVAGSLAHRLGLQGGDRVATIDGQQLVLGGDLILSAQGIELHSIDDLIQSARAIRDQPPDAEVRMRVLRAGQVVDLAIGGAAAPRAPTPAR